MIYIYKDDNRANSLEQYTYIIRYNGMCIKNTFVLLRYIYYTHKHIIMDSSTYKYNKSKQ